MTRTAEEIDHLSASSIKTYLQCPAGWAAQYLDQLPRRLGSALIKGKAVDKAAEHNWRQKPGTGEDVSVEEAQEVAEFEFYRSIDQAGGKGEIDWDNSNAGTELDSATRLTRRHMIDHAPLYTPVAVQVKFEKPIPGRDRVVIGFADAVIGPGHIADVKTGGRRMNQGDAERDLQATAYAWGLGEQLPLTFTFARVIHSSSKAQTSSELIETTRTERQVQGFEQLAKDVSDLIDVGVFPRSPGYHCSWCSAQNTCPVGGTK